MRILGFALCFLSVVLGLYVGVWVCFIGGIIEIIQALITAPINLSAIAFGILRIMLAAFSGWLTFGVLFLFGWALIDTDAATKRRRIRGW